MADLDKRLKEALGEELWKYTDIPHKLKNLIASENLIAFQEGIDFIENALGDFDDDEFTTKGYDRLNQITARAYRVSQAELEALGSPNEPEAERTTDPAHASQS